MRYSYLVYSFVLLFGYLQTGYTATPHAKASVDRIFLSLIGDMPDTEDVRGVIYYGDLDQAIRKILRDYMEKLSLGDAIRLAVFSSDRDRILWSIFRHRKRTLGSTEVLELSRTMVSRQNRDKILWKFAKTNTDRLTEDGFEILAGGTYGKNRDAILALKSRKTCGFLSRLFRS